jgi:hypothetical protein
MSSNIRPSVARLTLNRFWAIRRFRKYRAGYVHRARHAASTFCSFSAGSPARFRMRS